MHTRGFTWQYHNLADFQLGVKLDSISPPDIAWSLPNATLAFAILAAI